MAEIKRLVQRYKNLQSSRINWEDHWDRVAQYILPNKDNIYGTQVAGERKNSLIRLFDSTAIKSNVQLASALHSMLTNPTIHFFGLTTGEVDLDASDEVNLWLQSCVDIMHRTLDNSNFQTEIHETYLDLGCFGTASLFIEEDDRDSIRFKSRPVYEMYLDENSNGMVDTAFRKCKMTLRQIIQEFGEEALTEPMKREYNTDPGRCYEVIHAIMPRSDAERHGRVAGQAKSFASIYFMMEGEERILKEGGYDEFPLLTPRWKKVSGEIYGRSPGMDSLPTIQMVNKMMETTIKAAQKVVDPPWMLPDDSILGPFDITPGSTNFYRSGTDASSIFPLESRGRVDFGLDFIENERKSIREAFFIDQLQLREGPQMTATEVMARTDEQLRMMAPILGRLQFELLRPLVDRLFSIMMRRKELPPAPASVKGKLLSVEYVSQIARAQRVSEAQNITRAFQIIAPILEMMPESQQNIDGDAAVRYTFKQLGVSEKVLRKQADVKAMREQAAEEAMQQEEQQQGMMEAEAASKTAPMVKAMQ
jgi:hypothetical protein